MRTTLRIDDDLAEKLKNLAHKEDISFGRMLNRVLRQGIAAAKGGGRPRKRFRQKSFDLGEASINIDKALAIAAGLDDDETARKLAHQKRSSSTSTFSSTP